MFSERQIRNAAVIAAFAAGGSLTLNGVLVRAFEDAAVDQCQQKIEQNQGCTADEVKRYTLDRDMKSDLFPGLALLGGAVAYAAATRRKSP